ncbi:hypothetical protein J2T19_002327 [Paenibacillus tundrae]|uniref:Uncharacterized protein n=1 Tax=Paenibacillus tundrae TaxID=528187 RepID=A0ABT9WCD2_9BACL|nr:hypothetical protein [Paenibacillus tundrae]
MFKDIANVFGTISTIYEKPFYSYAVMLFPLFSDVGLCIGDY